MMTAMNPSARYASSFVTALIGSGLKHLCLTPGSRHSPLILAFARYKDEIKIYSHLDERSAAFFALGLALALDEPVALACTSGTAAANFFPAIVEAHQSHVPLIVLTADRPHELRGSGANQTIDQIKIFGDFVEWFVDAPLPEADPPARVLRYMQTLAARAYAKATERRGVVHINLPFRKPLEPDADDQSAVSIAQAATRFWRPARRTLRGSTDFSWELLLQHRGIIYFGHGTCRTLEESQRAMSWAADFSRVSGWPIFAELTSNLRCLFPAEEAGYKPLAAYESYATSDAIDFSQVKALIRFGAPPLAKNMQSLFLELELKAHIYASRAGEWADDTHSITDHISFWDLTASIPQSQDLPKPQTHWLAQLTLAEAKAWEVIQHEIEQGDYFDGGAVYDTVDLIPAESTLFAGSSLPVRHLDQFGKPGRRIFTWANRGASGIDGAVSTALGNGAARPEHPLVAILGDITFYHDMNGLLAVRRCGLPITIVLLNNNSGGIFHRLPIRAYEPHFSDYFITAHGLDFSHAAKLYGLEYVRADCREVFRQAFAESVANRQSAIIEVKTDAQTDLKRRAEIMAAVHAQLKTLSS